MNTVNADVVIAKRALDSLKSDGLVRESAQPAFAARETCADSVKALNGAARGVIDSLQSGGALKGTVVSHVTVAGVDVARVAIELPMLGWRQVLVRDEQESGIGEEVAIECVPNVSKPSRYVFRLANGAPAPGKIGANQQSRQ